jgi:hypothetical protein
LRKLSIRNTKAFRPDCPITCDVTEKELTVHAEALAPTMAQASSHNKTSSQNSSNSHSYDDIAADTDRYMAAIDRSVAASTVPHQLCPYHQHLIEQMTASSQAKCCVLQTWLDEVGHEQSAVVCPKDNDWMSISRPCTCAQMLGVEAAPLNGQS